MTDVSSSSKRRAPGRGVVAVARSLAFAVATVAIFLPIAKMVIASFRAQEVVFADGTRVRVAAHFVYERSVTASVTAAGREVAPDGMERDFVEIATDDADVVQAGDLQGSSVAVQAASRTVADNTATRVWLNEPAWTTPPRVGTTLMFSLADGGEPARPNRKLYVVHFQVAPEGDPDGELTPVLRPATEIREVTESWTTAHYRDVWGPAAAWVQGVAAHLWANIHGGSTRDPGVPAAPRTIGLLLHSLELAGGAALLALLLGVPIAWSLARTTFFGRRLLGVLLAGPLLLPPFFAAMGISGSLGVVLHAIGLTGGTLQLTQGIVCLGGLLAPVPALLVGRALAMVPAGLVEAAILAGGPRAATRGVVIPSVKPAALAAFTLVFVIALCDFSVPDLLGALLPSGAVQVHVFATEIFLQWDHMGNVGRAVATGAPFFVVVLALVFLCVRWLVRSPAGFVGGATRTRAPIVLKGRQAIRPWLVAAPALGLGFALPVGSVIGWGFKPSRVLDTIHATAGLVDDTTRWLRLGLLAAIVATATAVVLARAVLRGRRAWRPFVLGAVALPLSVPGMLLMVGTLLVWLAVPAAPGSLWKGTLVLVGRFLPHAIVAVALAVRAVEPKLEESARMLGAGPVTIAARIWGPLSARGIASAFLLVLVLALRELDAVVLIEPGILPVRIYDKVHYGRTGAVADLSMAYLGMLLIPALLAAVLMPRTPRREAGGEQAS